MNTILRISKFAQPLKSVIYCRSNLYVQPAFVKNSTWSSRQMSTATEKHITPTDNDWKTIYRLPLIRLASAFNRIKIYQGILTALATPAVFVLEQTQQLPINTGVVFAYIGISGFLTLCVISIGVRNLVGFVYINENVDQVRLAYVDYWGRRKESIVNVDDIVVPEVGAKKSLQQFFYHKINVYNDKQDGGKQLTFKFVNRFAVINEPHIFSSLFGE